jgi:hypothetical protein
MQAFWLTFTDGSQACCEGESAYHAKKIAEHFTKKTVAGGQYENISAQKLPYPASPVIWQFEDPINGKCPTFCHSPRKCVGGGCCPQSYSCTE